MSIPYTAPNFTVQDAATYKANIDAAFSVVARAGAWFVPAASATPNMTVTLGAGYLWDGTTKAEIAAQTTGTITAPVSNPRIDRIVVDAATGAVTVVGGTESATPAPPAIPAGKMPVAYVYLVVGQSAITNANITDERAFPTAASVATTPTAVDIDYDNGTSGLTADNVQDAVDELDGRIGTLESDMTTAQGDISSISSTISGYGSAVDKDAGAAIGNVPVLVDDGGGSPALPGVSGKNLTGVTADKAGIPQSTKSADYTCVLGDANTHILHPSADTTARTFTIPANATVAYAIGTALTFVNQNSAGAITIAITTDTMRLAGGGTTGSRTLSANGIATALKITATEWIISGSGLT